MSRCTITRDETKNFGRRDGRCGRGRHDGGLNPATGRDDRAGSELRPRKSTSASSAPTGAPRLARRRQPKERSELLHEARRRDRGQRGGARAARDPRTSASRLMASRDEMPVLPPTTSASSPARPATSRASRRASTSSGYTSMIRREPIGIVAGIAPWNYPLMMAVWKLGPGARRRQRADPEAVRADAADRCSASSELA